MRRAIILATLVICVSADIAAGERPDGVYVLSGNIQSGSYRNFGFNIGVYSNGTSASTSFGDEYPANIGGDWRMITACWGQLDLRFCKIGGKFITKIDSAEAGAETCSFALLGNSLQVKSSATILQKLDNGGCAWTNLNTGGFNVTLGVESNHFAAKTDSQVISTGRVLTPGAVCIVASHNRVQSQQTYGIDDALLRISDPTPGDCDLPPFRAVSLNPYWSYPDGAGWIDLMLVIAKEIDAPGSMGVPGNGGPLANRVSADGVSRLIIGVRTLDGSNPVEFSLPDKSPGTLKSLETNFFADGSAGTTKKITVSPSKFEDILHGHGAKAAAAVFVAPDIPLGYKPGSSVDVTVRQAGKERKVKLFLDASPVLLVHGLNSDGETWSEFRKQFPQGKFPLVDTISYDSHESFAFPPKSKNAWRQNSSNAVAGERKRDRDRSSQRCQPQHGWAYYALVR